MGGLKWALGCVLAIAVQVQAASAQLVYPGICERTHLSADTQAYCDRIVGLSGDELAQETARENEHRRIARSPERAGYYDTVWPSEHTDLWRSHAVVDAGLPADFDPSRLAISTVRLNLPVWGYTRKRDEVFISGGSPFALDSFTQAIKDGPLTPWEFAASLLRGLLNPSVPYVAKINPWSMQITRLLHLTQGRNRTVNYTGGLLMHQNGYVYAVAESVLYKIHPHSMQIVSSIELPLVSAAQPFWTTYNGMQVVASGKIVLKGFDFLNSNVPGLLLLVDPDDLSIVTQQEEPVLSARLTINQTSDGRAWLYHNNTTESLRFEITDNSFILDESWTRTYRTEDDGTTQASSPLVFGEIGQIVFADNTAPGATTGINLYIQPEDIPASTDPLIGTPAFNEDVPGFNFFMVAGDPFEQQLVVFYDPINNLLSAHDVGADGTLALRWESNAYKASASPAVAPDRDLLYIDNYLDDRDEFVILRLSTGEELAKVPLDASLPTIGAIFLGMNNDVYIISSETGGADGLVSRVHLRPDRHRHRRGRGR